jgi:hypothetical protein
MESQYVQGKKIGVVYVVGFILALAFLVATLLYAVPIFRGRMMGSRAGDRLEAILPKAPVVMIEPLVMRTPTADWTAFRCRVKTVKDRDALMKYIEREVGPELQPHLRLSVEVDLKGPVTPNVPKE